MYLRDTLGQLPFPVQSLAAHPTPQASFHALGMPIQCFVLQSQQLMCLELRGQLLEPLQEDFLIAETKRATFLELHKAA